MAHTFEIVFDPLPERKDRARPTSMVVIPRDRFTERLVSRGVSVHLKGLEKQKAQRSLSGALFFEGLPTDPPYQVEVDAKAAGYLPVETQNVDVVDVGKPPRKEVFLDLSPERVIDGETAVLRGQVLRDGKEIEGALVTGLVELPDGGGTATFETQSGRRGAFALRVELAKSGAAGAEIPVPLTTTARVRAEFDGVQNTTAAKTVTDMKTTNMGQILLPA